MRYKQRIGNENIKVPLIPLMHTCDGIGFRGILEQMEIEPRLCQVFNEHLAYYFYGRPAYRLKEKTPTGQIELFPVCFIINPNKLNDIERAFPFDTGAFKADFYSQFVSSNLSMEDFIFEPEYDFIRKYIGLVFDSNANYYKGKPVISLSDISPLSYELRALFESISNKGSREVDDRCFTIEVQSKNSLNIDSESIEAIVLPSELIEDEDVLNLYMDYDIELITYEVYRSAPSSTTSVILNKVSEYYQGTGRL